MKRIHIKTATIAIDAGTKFLKAVRAAPEEKGLPRLMEYLEHQGAPEQAAADLIRRNGVRAPDRLVLTGLYAERLSEGLADAVPIEGSEPSACHTVDEIAASIEAAKSLSIDCRHIVDVGAGSIKCIELDEGGGFGGYRENGLCAAGTGSFLDEQMRRMGYGYDAVQSLRAVEDPPHIAARCAVFAKSDLVHRQGEGYSREELWSGLCRGVVLTMLSTLFRGDIPGGPVLFCGGMFLNPLVRLWTSRSVPRALFHDMGHFLPALGAALLAGNGSPRRRENHSARCTKTGNPPVNETILRPVRSAAVIHTALREYARDGSEVRVHREIRPGEPVALGVDIGSTSTKCAIMSPEGEVLADVYRKTGGDPIGAAGRLFAELRHLRDGGGFHIIRAATTGSGRTLVGKLMGADLIVNEITAHYHGAVRFSPGVETVFEIGGQDSKYIRGRDGAVVDAAMNYVCAAGTGSFIEELAGRLGFDVREVGALALGRRVPRTSDRCTVFMEGDVTRLLREGRSREEALAAVLYAVAKNYLHRVVGPRPVTGERVFFQGATARNLGLVAAFEDLLGREIVVSPHCHVMGACGAALLAMERAAGEESSFRGLQVFDHPIRLETKTCEDCTNRCSVTVASVDGREISWGHRCGREEAGKATLGKTAGKATLANVAFPNVPTVPRRGRIGIPMALSMYHYLPLWKAFLEEMGFETVISGASGGNLKEEAMRAARSDFCFPLKLALAHARLVVEEGKADAVFFPSVMSERRQAGGGPRVFCPYVIAYPSLVRHTMDFPVPTVSPALDFRLGDEYNLGELYAAFKPFGVDEKEVRRAYRAGLKAHRSYLRELHDIGRRALDGILAKGAKAIVLFGRPYNLYDGAVNLGLPEHLREYGLEVLPYECMLDPLEDDTEVRHMYWHYGERLLAAADRLARLPGLFPVYFTNFGCGPDSFILDRFERALAGRPCLVIELDEHSSAAGYLTRIEAFMDVVKGKGGLPGTAGAGKCIKAKWRRKEKKLWIPPMHEYSARLTAAAFRAWGFAAEALPPEDGQALETGRSGARGSECLPAHTTIGAFLKKMRETGGRPGENALFMPTAEGPCRFGQYMVLHRAVLDDNGFAETPIFSPSSVNSYMGMPPALRRYIWDALIAGDMLTKCVCRVRPYERETGMADSSAGEALAVLEAAAERREDLVEVSGRILRTVAAVPREGGCDRPLVGVVGEIYVRCNPFCNAAVIRRIEECGGEAWLTQISEWVLYTAWMERHLAGLNGSGILGRLAAGLKTGYAFNRYHAFEQALEGVPGLRREPPLEEILEHGGRYLPLLFEGEALLTLGRARCFLDGGARMVVNCAPFGCMPGNITGAIFPSMQRECGKPVVTLFYDGEGDANRSVGVYLRNLAGG